MAFLEAAALTFGVILVAEFGDKTQLVLVSLALRGHLPMLFLGAALAFGLIVAVTVLFAGVLHRFVPPPVLAIVGGLLFIGFGIHAWREARETEEKETEAEVRTRRGPGGVFLSAFGFILVAELGDKTQFGVLALAATTGEPLAVALGAWLALVVVSAAALLLGGLLARWVPVRVVRRVAAGAFLLVGVVLLVGGVVELASATPPPGILLWPRLLGGPHG